VFCRKTLVIFRQIEVVSFKSSAFFMNKGLFRSETALFARKGLSIFAIKREEQAAQQQRWADCSWWGLGHE
jgi:hypothetical protein